MSSSEFAAAQQRVIARQQQRQAEAKARLEARRARQASTWPARLPFPLGSIGRRGVEAWDAIKGREGTRPAFRVGQVDAELLDEELLALLKEQVGEGLKYFGSYLSQEWSAEISLVLRAVLFKLSIWDHNASYGASLQGLRYTDARHRGPLLRSPSKWQKSLYGLCTVGGRYAWNRWEEWLISQEGGYDRPLPNIRLLSRLSSFLTTTHSLASLFSFLIFLTNGRYRTLLDRILRLRLVAPTSHTRREVSFEYLNRQLVWHAFTEFLLFVLPLVGVARWRRWLGRAWRRVRALVRSGDVGDERDEGGELAFLPGRTCAICYRDQNPAVVGEAEVLALAGSTAGGIVGSAQTDVTNPYEGVPCGCVYCFVCLATKLQAEEGEGFVCLRCAALIKECRPWAGDVLEEAERPTSGKSVSFEDGVGSGKQDMAGLIEHGV